MADCCDAAWFAARPRQRYRLRPALAVEMLVISDDLIAVAEREGHIVGMRVERTGDGELEYSPGDYCRKDLFEFEKLWTLRPLVLH